MRKGFTLTELLVCIAIIAILIALCLPLLSWIAPTSDPNKPKPVVQTETVSSRWVSANIAKTNIEHDGHKFVLFISDHGITSQHHPDCCKAERESRRH